MSFMCRVIRNKLPFPTKHQQPLFQSISSLRLKSTKKGGNDTEEDRPVRFTTSQAAVWSAKQSIRSAKKEDNSPWFEPYSILLSLTVFLIYFCVLREENDIDEELGKTLYDRISGLEKKQLEISLEYNLENNLDTAAIKQRLIEIEIEEAAEAEAAEALKE